MIRTMVTLENRNLLKIILLLPLFLIFSGPTDIVGAEIRTLEIEFSYTAPDDPAKLLLGFRLYKDGEQVCDASDHFTNKITCEIFTEDGAFNISLAAYYFDGTESPRSPLFPLCIGLTNTELAYYIQELYIGYLDRAADLAGLYYWVNEIVTCKLTMEQLRANLIKQPEYTDIYGDLTRTQMVSQIYQNLFKREPDADGLNYWVSGGGSSVNADELIIAFFNAASSADQLVLDNKIIEAMYYTENTDSYK